MVPPTQHSLDLSRWVEYMMYFSTNIVAIKRGLDRVQPEEIDIVIGTIISVIKKNEVESLEIFISGCARSNNKTIFWKDQEFKETIDSIINKDIYQNTVAEWNLCQWSNNNIDRIRKRNSRKRRLEYSNNIEMNIKQRKLNISELL